MPAVHVYIVAAEKSGDELGAKLAKALRMRADRDIKISGIGGSAMQAQGLISPVDISPLSILGLVEGLKSYPIIMQRVAETTKLIIESGADACVLIDSWGFMMRVAQRLKKHGYTGKIIKYVAPQVWAMREGRSKVLAAGVDHLLTIHSFDAPYFTRHGLPVTYVGNPVFDENFSSGEPSKLRGEFNISTDTPVLMVLFGSRLSEIQRLAAPFADAVKILKAEMPDLSIISPVSDTIREDVMAAVAENPDLQDVILLGENRKLECFALADASIACSGTVTTQLASAGIPTIVAYKLNWLTYKIGMRLFKPDYVSIVNIAAEQELMPEVLQNECTGENLARSVLPYLQNAEVRESTRNHLLQAVEKMRRGNAAENTNKPTSENKKTAHSSERAALAVLDILS